jgi:hypothetical protein
MMSDEYSLSEAADTPHSLKLLKFCDALGRWTES